jgi:hypothetical protein
MEVSKEIKEQASEIFGKYMLDLLDLGGFNDETYEINKKFALMQISSNIDILTDLKKEMFSRSRNVLDERIKKLEAIKGVIKKLPDTNLQPHS